MAVKEIEAKISCDECGRVFTVAIDEGAQLTGENITPFDFAEDAVRGGSVVYPHGGAGVIGSCSVQDGKMLCVKCTQLADEKCEAAPEGKHVWTSDPDTPRKEYCLHCKEPM